MYDYLGGEQVQVFYSPIFVSEDFLSGKPDVYHSGGTLRGFRSKDALPLKTGYYKYPQNFIIYDYRFEESSVDYDYIGCNIIVIKNGKLATMKWDNKLSKNDMCEVVVDNYGRQLNIKNISDFSKMRIEKDICSKESDRLTEELFPLGYKWTLNNDFAEYEKKEDELIKIRENTWGVFNSKWFKKNVYSQEMAFGELLECLSGIAICCESEEVMHKDSIELKKLRIDWLTCYQEIKNFSKNTPDIISRYVKWADEVTITEGLITLTLKMLNDKIKSKK